MRTGGLVPAERALRVTRSDPFEHGRNGPLVDSEDSFDHNLHVNDAGDESLVKMPARLAKSSHSSRST
jgi:hypothetical protein